MNLKKILCMSLLCATQSNFCMDVEQPRVTAPDDGQEWIEIKYAGDVDRFRGNKPDKLVAVSFNTSDWHWNCFTMPGNNSGIRYAYINPISILILGIRDTPQTFKHWNGDMHRISPGFMRGLTVPEMKEIMKGNVLYSLCRSFLLLKSSHPKNCLYAHHNFDELAKEHAKELEKKKNEYKKLDNLTPKEQRRYVRDHSGMLTLCGIHARRKSALSIISKDVLRDLIIKPNIPVETELMSKKLLEL